MNKSLIYKLSDKLDKKNETLKLIAIVLMFVDHFIHLFAPQLILVRYLTRIVFFIFSYQIAQGYEHTSNFNKYMVRLWVFAIISQIPYTLAFDTTRLNVIFTFIVSLFLIRCIEKKEYSWIFTIIVLSFFIPFEYGAFGVLLPVTFYIFRNKKNLMLVSQIIITVIYCFMSGGWMEMAGLAGTLLIFMFPKSNLRIRMNRYFFYWFYPLHLLFLFILKWVLIYIYFN